MLKPPSPIILIAKRTPWQVCGGAPSHMLAAIDMQLRAVDIARLVRAQEIDDLGHFLRLSEPAHGNVGEQRFGAGRENSRVDLAGRDGIDPDAARREVLSLIHISEPTRLGMISYAVFCLKT